MNADNITKEDHYVRSCFIQKLVQNFDGSVIPSGMQAHKPPKRIVQFWDDLNRLPDDVEECLDTWRKAEKLGIERVLFDHGQAKEFIYQNLGSRYLNAYNKCYHPAMQSDYFRLCYIFIEGGCYIDADDVYSGKPIQHLFEDGRLKIQPLCYDVKTDMMVPTSLFLKPGADSTNWIFYFNNNPLIACSRHPFIELALSQSTSILEMSDSNSFPEIQSTTGPGNLTKAIFNSITNCNEMRYFLVVLSKWEDLAKSKWELSYRNDARNWRHSNCRKYGGL